MQHQYRSRGRKEAYLSEKKKGVLCLYDINGDYSTGKFCNQGVCASRSDLEGEKGDKGSFLFLLQSLREMVRVTVSDGRIRGATRGCRKEQGKKV